MTQKNRRKHPRVKLDLLVQFRVKDYEELLRDQAIDLSVGGMFVRTEHPRPEGSMLYFQVIANEAGPLIEGLARVVRVAEKGGAHPPGMGLEFVNLEEGSLALVESLVKERLGA